jgi:ACS family D-galactonate transporter-like MFS transporter
MPTMTSAHAETSRRTRIVVGLLTVAILINYIDRSNMSVAAPTLQIELGLSATQLGFLLGAFFWSYTLMQMVVGWLVDHIGASIVMAAGFLLWSVATSVTGLVHGFAMLFGARLVLGVGESVAIPGFSKILAQVVPEERRGSANAIVMAGLQSGPAIGTLAGGLLMARFGWRPFFVVLGLASLVWLPPWLKFMPREPARSADEKLSGSPRLWRILRERSLWGSCVGQFAGNYGWYFLLTWLPSYLVHERGLSAARMAWVGAGAYISTAACSVVFGRISDGWIVEGASPTHVRKRALAIGYTLCAVFLLLSVVAGPHLYIPLLYLSAAALGGAAFSTWCIGQTIAGPQAAGRWIGVQNFIGNMAGIVAPSLTGYIVDRTGHFFLAFAIVSGVCLAGAGSWLFVVEKVEPIDWDGQLQQ